MGYGHFGNYPEKGKTKFIPTTSIVVENLTPRVKFVADSCGGGHGGYCLHKSNWVLSNRAPSWMTVLVEEAAKEELSLPFRKEGSAGKYGFWIINLSKEEAVVYMEEQRKKMEEKRTEESWEKYLGLTRKADYLLVKGVVRYDGKVIPGAIGLVPELLLVVFQDGRLWFPDSENPEVLLHMAYRSGGFVNYAEKPPLNVTTPGGKVVKPRG